MVEVDCERFFEALAQRYKKFVLPAHLEPAAVLDAAISKFPSERTEQMDAYMKCYAGKSKLHREKKVMGKIVPFLKQSKRFTLWRLDANHLNKIYDNFPAIMYVYAYNDR